MKKITSLIVAIIIFGSMFISNKVQAQLPGSLVPIVLLKHATGYWDTADKDSDSDGIIDSKDACPYVYGTINGCPDKDTDGDGIMDSKDKCPEVKGTVSGEGCPEKDTDGDGIIDSKDECPEVKGSKEDNGCPKKDTDGDGVLDIEDKCPEVKGPASNEGCPEKDTDGDGIPDSRDKCPEIKGTAANEGCVLSDEEKAVIKEASAHIYFQTGSSKIKQASYADLDRLTEILKKHPEVKARVEGHTDNTGNAQKNLTLSKARAASVKQYLIQHGEKADHVSSEGYGITRPVATNDTKEGRAKNRRVEVVVSLFE